jgi:uncharacterized protein with HEPN domain
VPAEFRRTLSDIPRSEVAGMRDKLHHRRESPRVRDGAAWPSPARSLKKR